MTRLKWNLVSVCLEIVLVSVQDRCTVCALWYRWLRNHFGRTQWYSYVMRLKWKIVLVYLKIVLMLTQDRCTVCVEQVSEIILNAPDGTPR